MDVEHKNSYSDSATADLFDSVGKYSTDIVTFPLYPPLCADTD